MRRYPLDRYLVDESATVRDALQRIEETERRTVFVVDGEQRLLGTVTDGDIRRWLLGGGDFGANVAEALNRHPLTVGLKYDESRLRERLLELGVTCVPQVDGQQRVVNLVFWEDIFAEPWAEMPVREVDVPVVIMAGGRGSRMAPFTEVLPKPLLPVGDKTVIEIVIDRFVRSGVKNFYLTLNYKANLLRAFFQDLPRAYDVQFVEEPRPMGTAGSLALLQDRLTGPFILTNCDIVVEADCHDLMLHHEGHGNEITMLVSVKKYRVPYGVCEIEPGGELKSINEKPEFDYMVNTGMYVVSPTALRLLDGESVTHMTDLMARVREEGGRVGVYPIGEKAWLDTGEWAEYRRTLQHFESRLLHRPGEQDDR